jgi:hypothetical protein
VSDPVKIPPKDFASTAHEVTLVHFGADVLVTIRGIDLELDSQKAVLTAFLHLCAVIRDGGQNPMLVALAALQVPLEDEPPS